MPVQDVDVSLLDKGEEITTTKTDIHGRFLLPEVGFGTVSLKLSKASYEPLSWIFPFEAPTQVVYAKMINLSELLDDTSDEIAKREWPAAQGLLDRAKALDSNNEVTQYLQAQLFSREGETDEAVVLLERLSSQMAPSFAVELTLADIYQNGLGQDNKAVIHLRKALKIKDDLDIEARLEKLTKNSSFPQ
jgi:tetratricopeptide (TPR) repeat protein